MRIRCNLLAVALASLTLVAFTGADPAPTTLRYQFKAGEKLPYTLEQDQKITMSFGGMDIEIKVKTTFDLTSTTLKVDDKGTAQIKTTVGHARMVVDGPTGVVTINSDDKTDTDDPIGKTVAPFIKAMANLEMTYSMDSSGEISGATFSEEALKKLKDLGNSNKLLGDIGSPDSVKSTLTSTVILPREAIDKGKSWTQKTNEKTSVGKVTGDTKYTYEGEIDKGGRKLARIVTVPNVKIEPDPNAPIKLKVKDSAGKGTILFDNKLGRLVESTTELKMKMELDLGGMDIKQDVIQTTTLRLKDTDKKE